jgi:hypothetical protein
MKRLIIGSLFLALLGFGALKLMPSGVEVKARENLPWQVSTKANGDTHVIGVDIGDATFKELMFKLKLLAEPALFEAPDGSLSLEAYFGKKKFGILEARLIAEMDADVTLLKKMLKEHIKKEAMPSNYWKYGLTVANTKLANELRVWRLIYVPVTDYEPKQMNFFGKPEEIIQINETAQYWLYPSRGMALLWDKAGSEIFYYVAQKDFARLKASLPMEIQVQRF